MYKKISILTLLTMTTTCFAINSQPLTNTGPMPQETPTTQSAPLSSDYRGTLPGFYIGIAGGYGRINTPHLEDANDWSDPTMFRSTWEVRGGVAGRVFAGYLAAVPGAENLHLGLEAGYNIYAASRYTMGWFMGVANTSWCYSGYNIDLLGVAKINVPNSGFHLLLKGGGAYVVQSFSISHNIDWFVPYDYENVHAHAILPVAAVGLGFDLSPQFSMDLTATHAFGANPASLKDTTTLKKSADKVASVTTVLIGVAYHF